MYTYRITKYNPKYRNEAGAYLKDEWTSVGDVGETFDGLKLTFEEYKKYEDAYLEAVLLTMKANGIDSLKIRWYGKMQDYESIEESLEDMDIVEVKKYVKELKKGQEIKQDNIALTVRLILREIMWGKLLKKNVFYVHFGYDYYMYIGSRANMDDVIKIIGEKGLFAEEMLSPYLSEREIKHEL